jgi:hypothetical protein
MLKIEIASPVKKEEEKIALFLSPLTKRGNYRKIISFIIIVVVGKAVSLYRKFAPTGF